MKFVSPPPVGGGDNSWRLKSYYENPKNMENEVFLDCRGIFNFQSVTEKDFFTSSVSDCQISRKISVLTYLIFLEERSANVAIQGISEMVLQILQP